MRQSDDDKRRERDRAARYQRAQHKDIAGLLNRPEFRRYVKRYLALCNVFKTTFTGNSETFFREGQRSIGTTMFGEIMQVNPERFADLMREPMPEDDDAEDDAEKT